MFDPSGGKGIVPGLGEALRKAEKPRRASYSLWLLVKVVQTLATMAAVILLVKAGEFMIIVAHLW